MERRVSAPASEDDVIEESDAHDPCGPRYALRYIAVLGAGTRISRRMLVSENDTGGTKLDGRPDDHTRINNRQSVTAHAQQATSHDPVTTVEVNGRQPLPGPDREGTQEGNRIVGTLNNFLGISSSAVHDPTRELGRSQQTGAARVTYARHRVEDMGTGHTRHVAVGLAQ